MSVHRLAIYGTEDPFTRIPNTLLNDERLDLKARGLLVFMLSKPNGWTFRERSLAKQTGVGRDQVRAAMQRLIDTGYVVRRWSAGEDGPPIMVTEVYDRAREVVGNPTVGKPDRRETQPLSNEGVLVTNEKNSLAPAARERKPRERDLLFEAVADTCRMPLDNLTASARGQLNRAVKELREIGATPEQVTATGNAYRKTYPDTTLTPTALTKHWHLGARTPAGRPTCECGQTLEHHDPDIHNILLGDPDA